MNRKILVLLSLAAIGYAQDDVRISEEPANVAITKQAVYNGSNQIIAMCHARSTLNSGTRPTIKVAISAISKATPAVITSTTHGIPLDSRPMVTISGATGTGWTTINGTWTATPIDADTFSVVIDSTGFGTLGGTVIFTTTGPRLTVEEWAIKKYGYDGSANFRWSGWMGGATGFKYKCSEASSLTPNQQ